ncbi:LysR family transcriptional regulator [Carnobacteriaceae bacterium zg-ZUI240]|nr:LysR family transcriptional regulator [Carnobacteriaceae bacterium zg-ZUI240]
MNYEEVETFLSVVEHGSIVSGAKKLYIGQGTASSRIKRLEESLGIKLFDRHPGLKTLSLTESGKEFLEIAHQYMEVSEAAFQLKNQTRNIQLNIASLDIINHFILKNNFTSFIQSYPNISINIQTYHSTAIHELINQMRFDIGFVFNLYNYPSIKAQKIFSEKMTILYFKNSIFKEEKCFENLNHDKEIFIKWSNDFQQWHNNFFSFSQKKIVIGTSAMLEYFLVNDDNWAIVPESVSSEFCNTNSNLEYYVIDDAPERNLYLITNVNLSQKKKKYIEIFLKSNNKLFY